VERDGHIRQFGPRELGERVLKWLEDQGIFIHLTTKDDIRVQQHVLRQGILTSYISKGMWRKLSRHILPEQHLENNLCKISDKIPV
jgi:hypothetical protein